MFIQDDNVIVATHGRGIWTLDLNLVNNPDFNTGVVHNFRLYPNPNNGVFYLELDNDYTGELSIHIYRIDGRLVYTAQVIKKDRIMKKEMMLHPVNPGEYILSLTCPDEQVSGSFIIK